MNRLAYTYVAVVSLGATALAVALPWSEVLNLGARGGAGLAAFIGLAILSEGMALDFAIGPKKRAKSSMAFLPLFACAITFPPVAVVSAVVVLHLVVDIALRRDVLWRVLFNTSQGVLSVGLAASLYEHVSRRLSVNTADLEVSLIGFFFLVLSFFLINILIVAGLYAIRQRNNIASVIKKMVASAGGNLLYDVLASPIAVIAFILYREHYIAGILLIILPLLLIRYSYISKIKLQRANRDLLRVLVKAIETRDPYTSGHSMRVSTLARMVADDLSVSRRTAERVETAALLHDIGKIDTAYATLIDKSSSLSEEERSVIRTHAVKGADLLRSLSSVDDEVIRGVRHHHERYDGTGYPDGLSGPDIPLSARIIAICDAVDAMLSTRPYRSALPVEDVRAELMRCSGRQFDPEIVDEILRDDTLNRAAGLLRRLASDAARRRAAQPA